MMRKCAAFMAIILFLTACSFSTPALAQEIALYLDSTKIQLLSDSECFIRITSNAVVKKDLPFTIEYDGQLYSGVINAGEKETKIPVVTEAVEKSAKKNGCH